MSTDKEKKPVKAAVKPKKVAAKTVAAKAEKPKVAAKPKSATVAAKAAPKTTKPAAKPAAAEVRQPERPVAKARPTHEQIAYVAYGYFLQRHGQHGNHEQDWLRAEQELLRLL
jgi:hypothetical protein